MIQRREFLATVAATGALVGIPKIANAARFDGDRALNWRSTTIQTVIKSEGNRAPVVTGVSLRPQSNEIAIVGDDHFISIYNQETNQFVHHLGEHKDWVRATKYSPDGRQLVTAGNDRRLLIWNTDQYNVPTRMATHQNAIIEVAFSADGQKLATVGFEEQLRIYDTQRMQLIAKLPCACNDNHAVGFSRDGRMIAAGGRCGTIRVWEVDSGRLISEFKAHRKRIRSIEFDAAGQLLSCAEDQTIRLTNPARPIESIKEWRHSAKMFDIKLIGQNLAATAGADNQVHIWRIDDSHHVGSLKGHTGTVSCLDANSTHLVSGSYDTHVRVWALQQDVARGDRQTQRNQGWNGKLK